MIYIIFFKCELGKTLFVFPVSINNTKKIFISLKFTTMTNSTTTNYWWASLLVGLAMITMGVLTFSTPIANLLTLYLVFGMILLFKGTWEITRAIGQRKTEKGWGWYLAGGVLDVLMSAYLLANPEIMPLLLTFWLIFRGLMGIAGAIETIAANKKYWGWALVLGILVVSLALIPLFIDPLALTGAVVLTNTTVAYLISFSFLALGVYHVVLAFQARKAK
jgi:uncharacterized membrane protein HdeD (DUF308 family)